MKRLGEQGNFRYVGIDNRVVIIMFDDMTSQPLESVGYVHIDISRHFDWGFLCDKSENLGLSILSHFFEVDADEVPSDLLTSFMRDFILVLSPNDTWEITKSIINQWIKIIMTTEDTGQERHKGINGELRFIEKDGFMDASVYNRGVYHTRV